jgi:hypothetical protein
MRFLVALAPTPAPAPGLATQKLLYCITPGGILSLEKRNYTVSSRLTAPPSPPKKITSVDIEVFLKHSILQIHFKSTVPVLSFIEN